MTDIAADSLPFDEMWEQLRRHLWNLVMHSDFREDGTYQYRVYDTKHLTQFYGCTPTEALRLCYEDWVARGRPYDD